MRRRTPLIALALLLAAAAWGWRSGVVDIAGEMRRTDGTEEATALAPPVPQAGAPDDEPRTGDAAPNVETGRPAFANMPSTDEATTATAVDRNGAGASGADPVAASPEAAPSFDVVRVEPNGSTVVAGRAEPGETVTLRNGTDTLAETKAGANGDFVLDLTLPTGEHRLRLADAANELSDDAAVVSVPARDKPGDLLVMMDRPGAPAEIITAPSRTASPKAVDAPASSSNDVAALASAPSAAAQIPSASAPAPARAALGVEAVEVENRRLSIAGAAPAGARLNIYLDDKLVGQTNGTGDDRFIANAMADVPVGPHVVRIDEIGRDGAVIARAEVPFTRPDENSMAAIAPSPSAPAPVPATPVVRAPASDPSTATAVPAAPTPTTDQAQAAAETSASVPSTAPASSPDVASASGPATVVQPALEATQAKVIIRRGDTLWGVSRRAYGQGVRYTVIYLANGDQIRDPDRIYPGQVFRMPDDEGRPPRT